MNSRHGTSTNTNCSISEIWRDLPVPCKNENCLDYIDPYNITDRGCQGLCPNYCVETIQDFLNKPKTTFGGKC